MGIPSSKSNCSEENNPCNIEIDVTDRSNHGDNDGMFTPPSDDTGSPVLVSDDENYVHDDEEVSTTTEFHLNNDDNAVDNGIEKDTDSGIRAPRSRRMLFDENPTSTSIGVSGSSSFLGNIYEESMECSHIYVDDDNVDNHDTDDALLKDRSFTSQQERCQHTNDEKKRCSSMDLMRQLSRQISADIFDSSGTIAKLFSRRISIELIRRTSDIQDSLPNTSRGWFLFASTIVSMIVGYEIQLQKSLTHLPRIYGQINNSQAPIYGIYHKMIHSVVGPTSNERYHPNTNQSIVHRTMKPSLFVGTRSAVASTAAYALGGPRPTDEHIQLREMLTMPADGATIAIDWELPPIEILIDKQSDVMTAGMTDTERRNQVLHGPIQQPVIIILHGVNNDSSFGYVRSLMRTCSDCGWIAVGMNFRGCGGVPLTTPRGYTGAYTGDIRGTVQILSARLAPNVPVFLVGNSLGANLVAKYLGEEGRYGTLPKCIAGGISLSNAMNLNASKMNVFWSAIIALGAKKGIIENYKYYKQMNTPQYNQVFKKVMFKTLTLKDFDDTVCPLYIRNDPEYPFNWTTGGYESVEEYWNDASSSRVIEFVSVPLLQLIATDDFLTTAPHIRSMNRNVSNPNIMVMETACGGHLGWQESPHHHDNNNNNDTSRSRTSFMDWIRGPSRSWANAATTQFIQAILESHQEKLQRQMEASQQPPSPDDDNTKLNIDKDGTIETRQAMEDARKEALELRSRL